MATHSLGPGTLLDGKYEILNLLGAGGMGEVFKARHVHLNTFRCIKVMKQGLLADDVYRARFLREAQMATQIHHPNIAAVHDFFLSDRDCYMVTEFIDGTTLRQWSATRARFPLAIAADVAVQVLGGLDHIHRRGLLHRDISADNVMLSYDADNRLVAKIIDLGIAKDINTVADTTQTGMMIGNPKYMSPEQLGDLAEGEHVDNRADLYCLGVVLYEMLLGVPPFVSETPHGYIFKHLTQPPARFAASKPGLRWPDGLEEVILRALEKDRRKRYSEAREFSAALEKFLSAPAGTLTRDAVSRLSEETVHEETVHDGRRTEERARAFEQSLLDDVRAKEAAGDRSGLKRLAEGHPPGSIVGDAVRDAIARLPSSRHEEDDAFQRAWEDGSTAAWRAFLEKHPSSQRAALAENLLNEAIAFEVAMRSESDTGLREFLKAWPEGRHHLDAGIHLVALKQRLADAAFEQAAAADSYAAMRDFIARFPTSRTEEAQRALEERLAFETAAVADSEDAWEDYLSKWSGDHHAGKAREQRDRIRASEEKAYELAAARKTGGAWETFLAEHPDGKRNARAERNRREAIAFENAKTGGRAALEEFLRTYPDGLLTKDARRISRRLADEDDFAQARALDTAGAWSLYVQTHPTGAQAQTARERLAAIEDAAFSAVIASKSADAAAAFVADFPSSPRRDQVSQLVAKWAEATAVQAALDAIARGDPDAAESLLGTVKHGDRRNEIVASVDALRDQRSWDEASHDPTIASLNAYLAARPSGRWAREASKRVARLREKLREHEPRDWDTAWETGNVDAWDRYLADHSDSARAVEARRCRQEAVDFDLAVSVNSPSMWRAFLKSWPEGRHRIDAEIRARSAK
jgi:serine/threonine protein kinase/outer membrane protein assembly factor BamD (BamD/ComL family)